MASSEQTLSPDHHCTRRDSPSTGKIRSSCHRSAGVRVRMDVRRVRDIRVATAHIWGTGVTAFLYAWRTCYQKASRASSFPSRSPAFQNE